MRVLLAAPPAEGPDRLVVHEWGTFTSFSGSDGVPAHFRPNNNDLPEFVYFENDSNSKAGRLTKDGTVSMETPVLYFYTDRDVQASVKVDFPQGWITEWYPAAAVPPTLKGPQAGPGSSIRWDVKLAPREPARFPTGKEQNVYYHARETAAVPLVAETPAPSEARGGFLVQRERFLFYRGVGAFPPPVTVKALGDGKVRIVNSLPDRVAGLLLVTYHQGTLGYRSLGELGPRAERTAALPAVCTTSADLGATLVQELTAAGLYEKEARAMVQTWEHAWFGEEGSRLLYLVPRSRTDELLPLKVEPKPTEVVRVLVGRHDFLTPEQEALTERQVQRWRAAEAEIDAARQEIQKLGRFYEQAYQQAQQRLDKRAAAPK